MKRYYRMFFYKIRKSFKNRDTNIKKNQLLTFEALTRILKVLAFFVITFLCACPVSREDIIMLRLYHKTHQQIWKAAYSTDIPPSYLAAVISLESYPPGNWKSKRFEPHIYRRLLNLKYNGKPFGGIFRKKLRKYSDTKIRQFATSYGPTQLMGYHCLRIGCKIKELTQSYHLQWAIVWMEKEYGRYARKKDWEACFRIHNTGRPDGRTYHRDYVKRGLRRMRYYEKWMMRQGRWFY